MQEGDVLGGKYRVIRRLGEGGEGSVFLAMHIRTEMFWAIKQIRMKPDGDDLFSCHELQMMKSLKNRHLPQIIDVLQTDDSVCLVMEHVRGVSLDHRLKGGQTLSYREVQDAAEQVTEALCYLESREKPVCHLDIKPSNLILRPDGLIKLVDFGSAWKEREKMRRTGTDGYAAPEQYLPGGPAPDVRADIYGLGATLYRMIAGKIRPPSIRVMSVPNCPARMSGLIIRCLEEDPSQRFQSASDLRRELVRIRKQEKRESGRRQLLGALAMALPSAALCLRILPSTIDLSADESWNYEKLLREAGVVEESESREYYRKAVFLEPGKSDAYLKYLSDAQMDGCFSGDEETFLRDTLHSVRPGSDQTYEELLEKEPEDYLKTALQIGLAYWYSCPRDDNVRIAMGWFEKAVQADGGSETEDAKRGETKAQAQRYLRLGTVLGKIGSSSGEDGVWDAAEYWEDMGQIMKAAVTESAMEDPLMQLKFCRESLQSIPFLSADLARAGIGAGQQLLRIRELELLSEGADVPPAGKKLQDGILEEIRQASAAAREAAEHIEKNGRSETDDEAVEA